MAEKHLVTGLVAHVDAGKTTLSEALLYAEILRVIGYHPPHNTACNGCYAEYMKDCI